MCPPFTLIVHLKACKREFERVIGERSRIAAISGSRAVRDLLRGLRDLLGSARPFERLSTVQTYNWRDLLGSARPFERTARPFELSCGRLQNDCPIFLQVIELVRAYNSAFLQARAAVYFIYFLHFAQKHHVNH